MNSLSSVELLNFLYLGFRKLGTGPLTVSSFYTFPELDSIYNLILIDIVVLETYPLLMRDCENNHSPVLFGQNCI